VFVGRYPRKKLKSQSEASAQQNKTKLVGRLESMYLQGDWGQCAAHCCYPGYQGIQKISSAEQLV